MPAACFSVLPAWVHKLAQHDYVFFSELKQVFGNAGIVANKGNDYRPIISLNPGQKAGYVIWFSTHAAYDRIDVATITTDNLLCALDLINDIGLTQNRTQITMIIMIAYDF